MKALLAFLFAFTFGSMVAVAGGNGHGGGHTPPTFPFDPCDENTSCDFDAYAYVAVPLECTLERDLVLGCIERSIATTAASHNAGYFNVVMGVGGRTDAYHNPNSPNHPASVVVLGDALDQVRMSNIEIELNWIPLYGQDAHGTYTGGDPVHQHTSISPSVINVWVSTAYPFLTGTFSFLGVGGGVFALDGEPSHALGPGGNALEDGIGFAALRIGGVFPIATDQQRGFYKGEGSFDLDYWL